MLPNYHKAEWHLTYRCNLACKPCSRACFLKGTHTEDMTVEDAEKYIEQAAYLGWPSDTILIGGEPTMHADFLEFVRVAIRWAKTLPNGQVVVFSNGSTDTIRGRLNEANQIGASLIREEWKTGSRTDDAEGKPAWCKTGFVSPTDAGIQLDPSYVCFSHTSKVCGICVDHDGYSPCSIGKTLAKLLGYKHSIPLLKGLFDVETITKLTVDQCRHCGFYFSGRHLIPQEDIKKFNEYVEGCPTVDGIKMSPTWHSVFKDKVIRSCK